MPRQSTKAASQRVESQGSECPKTRSPLRGRHQCLSLGMVPSTEWIPCQAQLKGLGHPGAAPLKGFSMQSSRTFLLRLPSLMSLLVPQITCFHRLCLSCQPVSPPSRDEKGKRTTFTTLWFNEFTCTHFQYMSPAFPHVPEVKDLSPQAQEIM